MVLGLLGAVAHAQVAPAREFDAASIKTVTGAPVPAGSPAPDRFVRTAVTLRTLVQFAYDVSPARVVGGPAWADEARFNVNATTTGTPSEADMRAMVRRLLEQRFALRARTDRRDLPYSELRIARADGALGSQIRPASFDCSTVVTDGVPASQLPMGDDGFPKCGFYALQRPGVVTIRMRGVPMARLIEHVEQRMRRPIVDRTSLTGRFDLDLATAPGGPAGAQVSTDAPTGIDVALAEQLGLVLRSTQGSVDVVVIDSAEMPTAD